MLNSLFPRFAWAMLSFLLTNVAAPPAAAQQEEPLFREMPADSAHESRSEVPLPLYRLTLDYERSSFGGEIAPWDFAYLQLSRRTPFGTVLARANHAERFGRDGVQFEVDAYPKLTKGTYAYLNVGVSDAPVFPHRRFGVELFTSLPQAMEFSVGARRLEFDSRDVTLYTGSVGAYAGNYWISLRPFVTPREGEISVSGNISVRRYFGGADEYLALVIGAGNRPDDRLSPAEFDRLSSMGVSLEGRAPTFERFRLRWSLGYEREDLPYERERNRLSAGLGLETWF